MIPRYTTTLIGLSLLVVFLAGCGAPQQAESLALTEAIIRSQYGPGISDPCKMSEQNCKDYEVDQAAKIPLTPAAKANDISQSWSFTVCWIQRDIYGKWHDDCTWLYLIIVHRVDGNWCLDQNSCTKVYAASGQVERKDCCPR